MRYLKNVDYFRKYTNEDKQQTCFGACLSILAVVLMMLFAWCEVNTYLQPSLVREVVTLRNYSTVENDRLASNNIVINLDLMLYKAPCESIYIMIKEVYGFRPIDPKFLDNFYLKRVNSSQQEVAEDYINPIIAQEQSRFGPQLQRLLTQATDQEGCHIVGQIDTKKSPGDLRIFVNWDSEEIKTLKKINSQTFDYITMDHQIRTFSYGLLEDQKQSKLLFGEAKSTKFDRTDNLPPLIEGGTCEYYMKIIPHQYFLGKSIINSETYQYSLHYECQDPSEKEERNLFVNFHHAISSVGINYRREEHSLMEVLVSFVSLIGGIYVVVGIFHRVCEAIISSLD